MGNSGEQPTMGLHGREHAARPDPGVPQDRGQRDALRARADQYVAAHALIPPLSMRELEDHADALLAEAGIAARYRNFVIVMLSNAVWRDTFAAVPYERRILLLPQCLRDRDGCPARLDALGLLCEQCGACCTGELQALAEDLGYVVLVAEGTTVVTKLLESGKVDAVVGVSCLAVLEKAFPHMAGDAIPGLAIPLVRCGCDSTATDVDLVRQAIGLKCDDHRRGRIDIDELRTHVDAWFQPQALRRLLGGAGTATEEIGVQWMSGPGKRWRPLLALCAFRSLAADDPGVPEAVRRVGVAVECFHKASLVHDDIEDGDDLRYGAMTLHRRHGVPAALNVGDFLLGEGYRLIGDCGLPAERIAQLLAVAAEGHRSLSLGQGEELLWMQRPGLLPAARVIEIFKHKTAPAFEVALRLGAICAGVDGETSRVLKTFSQALGVAYQIQDDVEDFHAESDGGDLRAMRLSILPAIALESARGQSREALARAWERGLADRACDEVRALLADLGVEERARQLIEHYKNEALRALNPLRHAYLKVLLRRLAGRIIRNAPPVGESRPAAPARAAAPTGENAHA